MEKLLDAGSYHAFAILVCKAFGGGALGSHMCRQMATLKPKTYKENEQDVCYIG